MSSKDKPSEDPTALKAEIERLRAESARKDEAIAAQQAAMEQAQRRTSIPTEDRRPAPAAEGQIRARTLCRYGQVLEGKVVTHPRGSLIAVTAEELAQDRSRRFRSLITEDEERAAERQSRAQEEAQVQIEDRTLDLVLQRGQEIANRRQAERKVQAMELLDLYQNTAGPRT